MTQKNYTIRLGNPKTFSGMLRRQYFTHICPTQENLQKENNYYEHFFSPNFESTRTAFISGIFKSEN